MQWVMKSLHKDLMQPNEKAFQNRIKEAFGYKMSSNMWDKLTNLA